MEAAEGRRVALEVDGRYGRNVHAMLKEEKNSLNYHSQLRLFTLMLVAAVPVYPHSFPIAYTCDRLLCMASFTLCNQSNTQMGVIFLYSTIKRIHKQSRDLASTIAFATLS